MIISHILIQEYSNIVDQSFTFDTKYRFDLIGKSKNVLSINERDLYNNSRTDNIHINAIVGENGAGKTTLLNALTKILGAKPDFHYNHILILRDENTFYYSSTIDNISFDNRSGLEMKNIGNEEAREKLNLSTILYSNIKTNPLENLDHKYVSPLTEAYLTECSKHDCEYHYGEEISELDAYHLNEISRQISYFSNESVKGLDITIPDYLDLNISKIYDDCLQNSHTSLHQSDFDFQQLRKNYKNLPQDEQYIGKFYVSFLLCFLHEIDSSFRAHYIEGADLKEENIKLINDSLNEKASNLDYFKDLVAQYANKDFLQKIFKDVPYYTEVEIKKIRIAFNNKIKFATFLEEIKLEFNIPTSDNKNLRKAVQLYSESIYKFQFLTLKWDGLSSGENAKLNFYSRIYERIHNKLKTLYVEFQPCKNLIVLIDEGATFFHPEWQRSYIYDIMQYFQKVIIKSSIVENVHLILTSHSPFVISDLTRDQIVYLTKEKKEGSNYNYCKVLSEEDKPTTFAGNISSLYRNSFFLSETLIGKYSYHILDDVMDRLNRQDPNINVNQVEYLISEISEPILKNHISRMLVKYEERND